MQRERLLAAILNHLEILLNELGEDSGSFESINTGLLLYPQQ
ncbi:MAG: hypothetical protein CM1200mP10_24000 [Candidatus Neomarinimicrobiota bacterium]|nr:MAG: hypothetical protein CM1200mP10_24000 [Candidatus Neomarinimicrobiota bacterium]